MENSGSKKLRCATLVSGHAEIQADIKSETRRDRDRDRGSSKPDCFICSKFPTKFAYNRILQNDVPKEVVLVILLLVRGRTDQS